jgi:hypothetical protein
MNHTRKQWIASILVDPEVRTLPIRTVANFRIGTLAVNTTL